MNSTDIDDLLHLDERTASTGEQEPIHETTLAGPIHETTLAPRH
ncbi:hypothetical protein Ais01nite_21580 [Asanoa ishikariensis]|uniref:Uncharacterized protein n=1 Tax=Asanoa ishikariensis TaxID=137265 RepID=A0A1H3U7J1_9ACTN|nr:hypothetical protein [Asanoa ishikariensis]GIF64123.1 hypothetical protein Ais01nite_21580 [Asanoa ishikariensis]SDZ58473.1 hypothetical protein SAMN05421684_6715 [Asanoa ishikariensis]